MDLLNSYSVVVYLTDPIAEFVNELRREFTPDCPHRAHITILPPRPLTVKKREGIEHCHRILSRTEPFEVRLGSVGVFERTEVIKISVKLGASRLRNLHDSLNTGVFQQDENFEYDPHITLGQDLPSDKVGEYLEIARRRWAEFSPAPPICVESLTFVQQVIDGCWSDLAEMELGRREAVTVGKSGPKNRDFE